MYQKRAILIPILFVLITVAFVIAQEPPPSPDPIKLTSPPVQLVPVADSAEAEKLTINIPLEPVIVNGSDECDSATNLTVPGGASQVVNSFTVSPGDPEIDQCFWGDPATSKGFRTAWFQFTAPHNGVATVNTLGSSYDTVVAIYEDSNPSTSQACSELQRVTCNDDFNGFAAQATFTVKKNKPYFIEVADWDSAVSGDARLQLSLEVEDIETLWEPVGSMSLPRTRHAAVTINQHIYVVGGQTNVLGNPEITPRIDRYNTTTKSWTALGQMPGIGLSNTTAVFVNKKGPDNKCSQGCIYIPGGFDGGSEYSGDHWAYDLATEEWIARAGSGNLAPLNAPFAWSTAVTDKNHNGYYLIGGLTTQPAITTTAQAHNNVYFYNVGNNQWLTNQPPMTTARYGHMATRIGDSICVVGGIGTGLVLHTSGECLNTANSGAGWVPNIPPLNEPRYGAGSTIASDGRWYIYGGSDANHKALSSVEVYDPQLGGSWQLLSAPYDLGASEGILERAWPRGGFTNNRLWAIGGHATEGTFPAISLIERLFIGSSNSFMPMIYFTDLDSNDTLGSAKPIGVNNAIFPNFEGQLDLFDVYFFFMNTTDQVNVKLSQIPSGSNYDISIYNSNKLLLGTGTNSGTLSENVSLTLGPGRYYVMVERISPFGFPNTANYRLIVER